MRVLKFVRGDSYIAGVVGQVCARSQNKQNKPATKQKHLPKIGGRLVCMCPLVCMYALVCVLLVC